MSEFNNSNIPILGGSNGHKAKAGGFQPMLLMRTVDEDGTVEPETRRVSQVMTEHGPQVVEQAVLGRSQYVTAEDLVEMMRQIVQEEISNLLFVTQPSMVVPYTSYVAYKEANRDQR